MNVSLFPLLCHSHHAPGHLLPTHLFFKNSYVLILIAIQCFYNCDNAKCEQLAPQCPEEAFLLLNNIFLSLEIILRHLFSHFLRFPLTYMISNLHTLPVVWYPLNAFKCTWGAIGSISLKKQSRDLWRAPSGLLLTKPDGCVWSATRTSPVALIAMQGWTRHQAHGYRGHMT